MIIIATLTVYVMAVQVVLPLCSFIQNTFIPRPDLKINATNCDSIFIEISGKDIIVGAIYKPKYVDFDQSISQLDSVLNIIIE